MNTIILYLLHDVVRYMQQKDTATSHVLPYAKTYADTIDLTQFQHDVHDALAFIYGRSHSFNGGFAKVVAHMCAYEFAQAFDQSTEKNIFPTHAKVTDAIIDFLQTHTEQQVAGIMHTLLQRMNNKTPFIVVQTPIPLIGNIKQDLRVALIEKYGVCFPHFTVNKHLLGGLRIYVDGVTMEHTWQARLETILSDLYLHIT